MKKGFTLIELMGVMILVAIVLVVSVPAIINTIKKSEVDNVDRIKKDLFLATESYVRHNDDFMTALQSGIIIYVSVQTLIDEKYVSYNNIKEIQNIKLKYIQVRSDNLKYIYELKDTNS